MTCNHECPGDNCEPDRCCEDCVGPTSDPVASPDHYTWLPVEAIEITERFNFCMGNALKYVMRADHKGKPVEDIRKAIWYLERELVRRGYDGG